MRRRAPAAGAAPRAATGRPPRPRPSAPGPARPPRIVVVPHPPEGSRSRTFPVGAHLFVNLGEELHDHVLGGARLTMGRRTDNDVFVPDTLASKLHAELVAEGGRYYLEDRGSRNGTFLGKRRVEGRVSLSQAETIRIGNTYMLFCQGDVKARDQFLFCPQGHPGDRRAKFCGSCGAPLS